MVAKLVMDYTTLDTEHCEKAEVLKHHGEYFVLVCIYVFNES